MTCRTILAIAILFGIPGCTHFINIPPQRTADAPERPL